MLLKVIKNDGTYFVSSKNHPAMLMPALDEPSVVSVPDAMRYIAKELEGDLWSSELDAVEAAGYLASMDRQMKQGMSLEEAWEYWCACHCIGNMIQHEELPLDKNRLNWPKLAKAVATTINQWRSKYGTASI